ncbi:MAG: acetylesterase [Gammaproteobacteria bacterium HGW-Gammaproteobacteria-15]|nr:MAG: acetylesterase [Gammaproteobacteria bacterium HGW-Gammaproteobacteria-15]
MNKTGVKKMLLTLGAVITALAAGWYTLFGLKPYTVSAADVTQRYAYTLPQPVDLQLQQDENNGYHFHYSSFDGARVNGYMRFPDTDKDMSSPVPVLIAAHAMGRAYQRWWQDSYKDRPTQESTDKITAMALAKGYAVVTIDARNHGERKDAEHSIVDIINNLHWWGKREPYEQMLIDTVRDHRVLLDWLSTQPQFDATRIDVTGYSMGAQVGLLLAAVDARIKRVAAVVPPHINNRTAIVAPLSMLPALADNPVWLFSANDDEYASEKENTQLFNALPNSDKQHHKFAGGHLLPAHYVQLFEQWL